jgi:hypothetical protein
MSRGEGPEIVRVFLDIEERGGELFILVTDSRTLHAERPVTWVGGKRLLAAKGTASTITDPVSLADAIEHDTAANVTTRIERQREYGNLLFEAAFGQELWQELLQSAAGHPYLELAIRGFATDNQVAMQSLRWEALHDDSAFVAAQGAAHGTVSVSIVRVVPFRADAAAGAADVAFQPIDRIPRILFAVGSRLTDQSVRSGAEFMGIMRRLECGGGIIQPQVLDQASLESLRQRLRAFRPDALHLIGHGTRDLEGNVCLELRPESKTDDGLVTAEKLLGAFREAEHAPTVAVLSACETADPVAADPSRVSPLPFAARLVAGGVPLVIAIAGEIRDTACRVFTRALTGALGEGVPLGKAVISGRRAAFYNRPYDSADWILPTVFLAEHVPTSVPLARTDKAEAARTRIRDLGMHLAQENSVFCGRREFFPVMDKLLDGDDPVNVLFASIPDAGRNYGGTRLLRELGARAVRAGVIPLMLGPFNRISPTSLAALAEALGDVIRDARNALCLGRADSRVRAVGAGRCRPIDLADALRDDLEQLVAALAADDPARSRPSPHPQAVLLCRRVDLWPAFNDLLDMMGPRGVKGSGRPVPVVLTGAHLDALRDGRDGRRKVGFSAEFLPLDRLSTHDNEDILAYQWWLLNPPPGIPSFAPERHASAMWHEDARFTFELDSVFPAQNRLYRWARMKVEEGKFTCDTDEALLTSFQGATL